MRLNILFSATFGLVLTGGPADGQSPPQAPPAVERTSEPAPADGEGVALTGRVLYNGQPRPGVVMRLFRTPAALAGRFSIMPFREITTDAKGKYRVDGLNVGDKYYFEIVESLGMADLQWRYGSQFRNSIPKGRTEIELPDVKLTTRGQSLRGIVVDPKGKPQAGVTVSASLSNGYGMSLPRLDSGPAPWIETDREGRFVLRQLPDEPIELMAHKRSPAKAEQQGSNRILYPAKVRPALNQQDIRIVLDPRLVQPIEDLDAPKR